MLLLAFVNSSLIDTLVLIFLHGQQTSESEFYENGHVQTCSQKQYCSVRQSCDKISKMDMFKRVQKIIYNRKKIC